MTSRVAAIKAVLEADATLLATATGGIFDWDETGRQGLSRTATPGAFDSNQVIKPTVLVKLRSAVPDGQLADDASQYVSLREVIEIWLYADNSYSAIETMRDRVYVLLHGKQIDGSFVVRWVGDVRPGIRELDLDAFVERSDYMAVVKRSV